MWNGGTFRLPATEVIGDLALAQPLYPWYGVQTKPRYEKISAQALAGKGLTVYLPLAAQYRRWSDRMVRIATPLFPGYVFCRFDAAKRAAVLRTLGVISIVGTAKHPEPIADEEMQAVQAVVQSKLSSEPWPYVREGEAVRILCGPLAGVEGWLVRKKNQWRVVVSIHLLQRSVAVEVDREWVSPAC